MKLDKAYILDKIAVVSVFLKRFRFIVAFVVFSAMYAYIMMQVNAIDARQPSEKQIADKVTAAPRTQVDPELAGKITSLEDQNVQIQTIFSEARKNPFAE